MDKPSSEWIETLPYPVVVVSNEKNRISRNRLARKLLPPVSHLREGLSDFRNDFMRELRLDDVSYLVISLSQKESRVFCFFEQFLPLQEGISRVIMEKMQDFFWSLLNEEEHTECENLVRLDQIAARVHALRMHSENYLRLLRKEKLIEQSEAKTCSVKGLLEHVHKALNAYGVSFSLCDCEQITVCAESTVLSFLVLNLIQFAHLFEAQQQISLEVMPEGENVRFSMKISDAGAVRSSLEKLILQNQGCEELLYIVPMLCVLRLCLEKGIPWTISESEEETKFSFLLTKGGEEAAMFLADVSAEEVSELLQMIKSMFS